MRVPASIEDAEFGVWKIYRRAMPVIIERNGWRAEAPPGWATQTVLACPSWGTLHSGDYGEIVMDDSLVELRRHLAACFAARGRVLVTGLGLGCVVRGMLINPRVEHITVVEKDPKVVARCGPHLVGSRCSVIEGDALEIDLPGRFDLAWHDLHSFDDEPHLQVMHAKLFIKWRAQCARQGAWAFPREFARRLCFQLVGSPKSRRP